MSPDRTAAEGVRDRRPASCPATRKRGRPRDSDATATRARILHAAREVFSSIGYDRATMDEIAAAVGLSRAGIRNYYLNKTELHEAAFASVEKDALAKIMAGLPGPEAPTSERVMAVYRGAISINAEDLTLVRFWVTATLDGVHHPELKAQSERTFNQVRAYFESVLRHGQRRGELAADLDPIDTTQLLLDVLWGLALDGGFRSDLAGIRRILKILDTVLARALPTDRQYSTEPDPAL